MAMKRRSKIDFLTTLSIINAIILAGDRVAASVSGSGSAPSVDDLSKLVDELRGLYMPEVAEELRKKTESMKAKLAKEYDQGPLYIRAPHRKNKNTVRRRRK